MNVIAREPFYSLASFLSAVRHHAVEGVADPRLEFEAGVTGLGKTTGAGGGFLLPPEQLEAMWHRVYATGRLIRRCSRQPAHKRSSALTIPMVHERSRADGSRFGGMALQWLNEGQEFPSFKLQLENTRLFEPKKLGGIVYATDELIEDATALAGFFERAAALEISFMLEEAIVSGNGIGQPLGILKSPSLIEVAPEAGQAVASFDPKNLTMMVRRFWQGSFDTAAWLMGIDVYAMLLELNEETEIIHFDADGLPTIHGFSVILTEATSPIGQKGDILLADLSQYLLIERELGSKVLGSIHLRFLNDETAFRIRARVDGAPAWSSPVTVKNAALPVSPFVTLGARA